MKCEIFLKKNAITNNDLSIIWSVFYTQRADEGWNWNRKTLIALIMNLGEKLKVFVNLI